MTEKLHPLRALINMKKYKGFNKFSLTDDSIAAFEFCWAAISNCQELYFEDTTTPILQTDASDYIGGYMVLVDTYIYHNWIGPRERRSVMVYVWSETIWRAPRQSILIHKNFTYINVTLTGKVLRWKLYQFVPEALSRLCNTISPATAKCNHNVPVTYSSVFTSWCL